MVKQRKILVADDDRITREMIGSILTRAGHEVVFAEDGKSAVEMASSERPDLVFIDGLMPKMHGFLACKAIKELESPPKVILLTGVYTKPGYKFEAKGAFGADDLLKKPATHDELVACIGKHLPGTNDCEGGDTSEPRQAQPVQTSKGHAAGRTRHIGEASSRAQTPVFGCSLVDEDDSCTEGENLCSRPGPASTEANQ